MITKMRCLFAGTPEVAIPVLEALLNSSHQVVGVLTRPDAPRGRGRTLHPSPVASYAQEHGLEVIKASRITPEVKAKISELNPDVAPIVAYGALIPLEALQIPRFGWLNLHFSLLPRWRGAAPVQRAIAAGDNLTGACIFSLEEGLDTGPVYDRFEYPLSDHHTADQVLSDLAITGSQRMVSVIDALADGAARAIEQETEGVTYAHKLSREDAEIDFNQSAREVARAIHAVTSAPGAFTWRGDQRLKLSAVNIVDMGQLNLSPDMPGTLVVTKRSIYVHCVNSLIQLTQVAPAGKGWMDATAWARGARLAEGERLGRVADKVAN